MPSPENNINTIIKAGKLYMFTAARRVPYYLYDSKENAAINPGEPFLVIKTGCHLNGFNMVLVCNVRGEVGMAYAKSDIFIPYLSQ